jgi:hypothetical protein
MNRKTYELLILRYNEIHNAILKPCAEKEKFATLVQEVEQKLKTFGREILYPNNMTALEFATKLAADANTK